MAIAGTVVLRWNFMMKTNYCEIAYEKLIK
jgi:hypothetical protein